MIGSFCPLISDDCKQHHCVMWQADSCLIVKFFSGGLGEGPESEGEESLEEDHQLLHESPEDIAKVVFSAIREKDLSLEEFEIPEDLIDAYWEESGIELWELPKKVQANVRKATTILKKQIQEMVSQKLQAIMGDTDDLTEKIYRLSVEEGIDRDREWEVVRLALNFLEEAGLPRNSIHEGKIEKAIKRIGKAVSKRLLADYRERLAHEKTEVSQLVVAAVIWARSKGLTRFTHADSKTYLYEREINVLDETESLFYTKVNQELRRKK